jgi:low affinity Fe/Cu permease
MKSRKTSYHCGPLNASAAAYHRMEHRIADEPGFKQSTPASARIFTTEQSGARPLPSDQVSEAFRKFAHRVAEGAGSIWVFAAAVIIVAVWMATGPIFHYSDAWQLVINTGTTIVTFLMVFLIQNTQNRDARAIHLKLDELIRVSTARDLFMNLESLSDKELEEMAQNLSILKQRSEERLAIRAKQRAEQSS